MFKSIGIRGYKSIKSQNVDLSRVNILIGGNGAGKSNFMSVFNFMRIVCNGDLDRFVEDYGGANPLLYMGRRNTGRISFEFGLNESGRGGLSAIELEFREALNRLSLSIVDTYAESKRFSFDSINDEIARYFLPLRVYHFVDTGRTSPITETCKVYDNRFLRGNGSNLASVLYYISVQYPRQFARIEDVIRSIAPSFDGFKLEPLRGNPSLIRLEWKQKGMYDEYMDAEDFSDGTLRMICLVTLLMQPDLPGVVLIDEPELGLHPAALSLFCSLVKKASTDSQIIISTQSIDVVNQFTADDIIVCDNTGEETVFRRLSESSLEDWQKEYTLGELWEKNVFGGNP